MILIPKLYIYVNKRGQSNEQTFLDMLVGLYNEPFKLGVRDLMEN